ncbi:MAG: PAS domain S-box protein [Candidatus Sabulitectum sp.]|nr:PAS domain S-box protein [Candidatus Sabulitectum sp.]
MTNKQGQLSRYLELAFNQARELVYIKDSELRFLACNWSFADFFGMDAPEKAEGLCSADLMPALTAEEDTRTDKLAMQSTVTLRVIISFNEGNDKIRIFSCLKVPLIELDSPIGVFCIMRDITNEEDQIEEYRSREAVNSAIIHNAPVGISVRDSVGNLLSYNKAWQRIWNSSDESIKADMEHTRTELKLDDSDSYLSNCEKKLLKVYKSGGEFFVPEVKTDKKRDGLEVWVSQHFYAIMNPDNSVQRVVVLTVDISDQVYSRKALKTTQQNYKQLSETIPVGVFRSEIRENGLILSMNPAFRRIFGISEEKGQNVRISDILADPSEESNIIKLLQLKGRIDDREIILKKDNGSRFWASFTISTLTEAAVSIAEGVVTDITGRMNAFKQLQKTIDGVVLAMSRLVDMKDPYTSGHQKRVADLACAIGEELGMKSHMIDGLKIAGILHDIGKMAVPTEILTKPGAITRSEMLLLREHAEDGYDILKSIDFPWPVADIVLQHHERIDGSGYPLGIKGPAIRLEAKILAVADVVEAMATMRPYRASLGLHEALQTITAGSGVYFDRQVVEACMRLFMEKNYQLPEEDSLISFRQN